MQAIRAGIYLFIANQPTADTGPQHFSQLSQATPKMALHFDLIQSLQVLPPQ